MNKTISMEKRIREFPANPGVYLMKNKAGGVIYIGKAKNLRNRVRSYFSKIDDSRYLIKFLLSKVEDVDCIITDTEKEALILENNLIKKHKPRYNVNLKDDKTYFSLKLTMGNRFPRLSLVRKIRKDDAKYFGPYSSGNAVKDTLKTISKTFRLRTCTDSHFKNRTRPCLNYQIKRCFAPCYGLIDKEDYQRYVKEVILFLEGRDKELLKLLKKRMEDESDNLNFEEAARIRDRISSIEKTIERQKVVSNSGIDQDVFAFYREEGDMELQVMIMRGGRVLDTRSFPLIDLELQDREIISSFLKQYYDKDRFIPSRITIPMEIEDRGLVEEWFSEKKGQTVRIHVPKRGEKIDLLKMVTENAKNSFIDRHNVHSLGLKTLGDIQEKLNLKRLPRKIECFDISNISGMLAVGSMVTFKEGMPHKQGYRHFKIKTVDQADDYGMMYEVLKRRISRLSEGNDLPDLVIVDGGKGQLGVAVKALEESKRDGPDAISIAKGDGRDKIFIPHRRNPILLQRNSRAMLLLQQIRDEAHRFAITYHRKLWKKQNLRSILEDIPGVGSIRKKALLKYFGSLKGVKDASMGDLSQVSGMNAKVAKNVFDFFRNLSHDSTVTLIDPNISELNPESHRDENC